ncbi:MAG: type II toxin-antitoxin system RelE/ParE family toxin [Dehalococcoidales bacterium]|nr:type II toxin-antitoxin system RelE/ParE family toxin [Dehalococcoidales bacterium]
MKANGLPVFEVRLRSKRVQRELDGLQEVDHERIVAKLRALASDPRPQGCEKLYDSIFRMRVGGFRIIYLIDEENRRIEVGGIRRRSEKTYRGIEELFR